MESRAERAARNESLFRDVNERIADVAGRLDVPLVTALCECSSETCAETISITPSEYADVRARSDTFALLEGHEDVTLERVVDRTDRFLVVEKLGEGAEVARELDPRA